MDIQNIKDRRMKIDGAPWRYEQIGQGVFGFSPGGCNKQPGDYRVADVRGWGHLQYMGITRGDRVAQDMQDANGIFIANAPKDIDDLLAYVAQLEEQIMRLERVA